MGTTTIAGRFGDEGAAVVGLQDQRRAVLFEQTGEVEDDLLGTLPITRRGQQRAAAGQIANDQDVIEEPVDRLWRLGKVCRPDGAGREPSQPTRHHVAIMTPLVSKLLEP